MQSKRFLDVIKEINHLIIEQHLNAGDQLPSERELSERLSVGRSSVREALRALELLDVIETRRGEGTFIKPSSSHRLVDLLLMFMLRNDEAKNNLKETRIIIELELMKLAMPNFTNRDYMELNDLISKQKKQKQQKRYELDYLFHKQLIEISKNKLMINIWTSLVEFNKVICLNDYHLGDSEQAVIDHQEILESMYQHDQERLLFLLNRHLKETHF
ncbi:FadR/GntR family transcriptional regulator [Alkalihalobacillus trypoxylicola]|uniref:HTH gntR-type domain-containing protein n=1 Tax=Alkalihalobacillus trypoxylicola TaxID=519424 RepID=A0A162EB19_9BACI|nr:GntR family transcriptional regulator [Alkalihalobacillus trypoxylicola]KYG32193.1 hypothetical protein AZF04_05350 [Alkalihalobacillus trypoxylicola]